MLSTAAWRAFEDELSRWQDAGRTVEFWWRDDDAGGDHPALRRLLALAAAGGVPLALAVIPAEADAGVLAGLPADVAVLQHGCDHRNRAPAGAKKCEFPATEAGDAALARMAAARRRLQDATGGRALPVLVPPWNRLGELLAARLAEAGYAGLSRFGARAHPALSAPAGLHQVNTHVDLIDWRGSRGFAGDDAVLGQALRHLVARREGHDLKGRTIDSAEPTGWLSHHLVHDPATWEFLEQLFAATQGRAGVRWRHAVELFAAT